MNYGESLAYWYFRLNGFIPMMNFVLHEPDKDTKYNSDSDLLAVRFPYVYEDIGGKPEDWDNDRFAAWGLDHGRSTVLLICEVKTGKYKKSAVNNSFKQDRLRYAIMRLGAMPLDMVDGAVRELLDSPVISRDVFGRPFTVAKVLLHVAKNRPGENDEWALPLTPCHVIDLSEALRFIHARMKKYAEPKGASRMFFPGDLIQFLAWSAGVPINVDPPEEE